MKFAPKQHVSALLSASLNAFVPLGFATYVLEQYLYISVLDDLIVATLRRSQFILEGFLALS